MKYWRHHQHLIKFTLFIKVYFIFIFGMLAFYRLQLVNILSSHLSNNLNMLIYFQYLYFNFAFKFEVVHDEYDLLDIIFIHFIQIIIMFISIFLFFIIVSLCILFILKVIHFLFSIFYFLMPIILLFIFNFLFIVFLFMLFVIFLI
jgi:hypothetical protein